MRMKREIRLNFYQVQKCGYYHRGSDVPTLGELPDMLSALHDWITNSSPTIRETQTFSPHEYSDRLPVYCYNIQPDADSGDFLLTTWNETETTEGRIASIDAEGTAGSARVTTSELEENTFPGYPGYFWFLPSHELIICIRLDTQRLGGHPGMVQYLNGYLERFSPWVELDGDSENLFDLEIEGYGEGEEIDSMLKPRFQSTPVRLRGEIDYIRKNRERIRKIIRRDDYDGGVQRNPSLLRRMLKGFGLAEDMDLLEDTRYQYELNLSPSRGELDRIIDYWNRKTTSEDASRWDDVGFAFTSESNVRWLSQSTPKETLEVNVRIRDEVLMDGKSLMKALQEHRDSVLNRIRDVS